MSYELALEAAGAKVVAFQEFGSYQGDWLARLDDGRYVTGSYGSCSGCDAFEGEFGYGSARCEEHEYIEPAPECAECSVKAADYSTRLARFGAEYLDGATTYAALREKFVADSSWDYEAKEVIKWLDEQEHVA